MKIDYALLLLKLSGFTGGPCMKVNHNTTSRQNIQIRLKLHT